MSMKSMSAAIINRRWAKTKEFWSMAHLLVLSVGLEAKLKDFKLFTKRIITLKVKSGNKFLVQYLKECIRMVIAYMNHDDPLAQKAKVRVKHDRAGLPTIIPGPLRVSIKAFRSLGGLSDGLVLRTVLTILSFYRVINFVSHPNLGTITDPFTGTSPLLSDAELDVVVELFGKVRLGKLDWFISESAGPNGPRATWFAGADALAYLRNPKQWVLMVCFMIITGRIVALAWFLIIQVLSIPGLAIALAVKVKIPFKLGRLAALDKDGAGKRRIVAITDFWTQLVFKPIHDCLFAKLARIEQDGTFDQWKPIETWVIPRLRLGAPAFSFDLSAATDRLPIAFQRQIIERLFGRFFGYLWMELLNRDWWYTNQPIRYAVGQPIGAYSSWAMLAVSHHMIVQLAALRAGFVGWFPYYAVLGDDLVIADAAVAEHYQAIMRHLGVPINLQKSILSENGVIEFAKRWYSVSRGEFSALGPGLLLAATRNAYLFSVLALQLFERDWLNYLEQLRVCLRALTKQRRNISERLVSLMFATVVGPSGLLRGDKGQVTAFAEAWFASISKLSMDAAVPYLILGFKTLVEKDMADKAMIGQRNLDYFLLNWMKKPILHGPSLVAGILSSPLILVSPGFWIYLARLWKGRNPSYSASLNLAGLLNPELRADPQSIQLDLLDLEDLSTIDWKRRPEIKQQFTVADKLIRAVSAEIERAQSEGSSSLVPYHGRPLGVIPYAEPRSGVSDCEL